MSSRALLIGPLVLLALAPAPAAAKKYTLPELIELSHANPALQAGAAATAAAQSQVTEAWLNWLPTGNILSLLAPSPQQECFDSMGDRNTQDCLRTTSPEASLRNVSWSSIFTHTELQLIQPVYDFGKISAGVRAAKAGVEVSREKAAGTRADLELNVRKAYFGLKLAREILDTLDQGGSYVDDAQQKIEKELSKGTGNSTVTDRLRLRTVHADLDARLLETKRLQTFAYDGLRALVGPQVQGEIDVDDEDFEPPELTNRPVTYYEDLARANRPEVKMLASAVRAKQALADLERRKAYPDLILVGGAVFARAQGVDNPQNAFYSHYYNSTTAGVAAGLRIPLDLGPKIARAQRLSHEAEEAGYQQSAALSAILLDVHKAYGEVTEARDRVAAMEKGQKSGKAWISAVAQNFALGLAETRDFSDALIAFFGMRTRYLQAVYDLDIALSSLARATGVADLRSL